MNKKFTIELKTEFEVSFSDVIKAHNYFIEGDWKETFYTYNDLEDLVGSLGLTFFKTEAEWNSSEYYKFIEGFGEFTCHSDIGEWLCEDEEFGIISIQDSELETDFVYEE